MKSIAHESPILASEGLSSTIMGIDPKNAARITKYLRDGIYADKIRAVVHELLSNAFDEHVKFNIEKPVSTGIKKDDSGNVFFVRDYAKGLSEKDIRGIFGMYANSTKMENNNQQGCFGIGSKVLHSYTDTFFVDSHFEGVKTTYACALGGDEANISVGHIYKVNEEETSESGLEVYGSVKPEDISKFSNKIRDFISLSPHNVEADILGIKINPVVPSASKKIKNYNVRLLEYPAFDSKNLLFQMGGNTYKSQSLSLNGAKIKNGHCLVVDIPIGTCSVVLSREGFEETIQNEKVFSEIDSILSDLAESDLSQFKTKSVFDLVNDSLSAMTSYEGEFFQTYAKNLYKGVWNFVEKVSLHNPLLPAEKKNNKPLCAIIPNNDARNYWVGKVKNYLKDSSRNIYTVQEGDWKLTDQAIQCCFELVSARKLPYPKTSKVDGRFAVYRKTHRRVRAEGKFNALELFNHASQEFGWNFTAKLEEEAADYLEKKYLAIKTTSDLARIAVRCSTTKDSNIFTINSSAFLAKLESIGFIAVGGQKWSETTKRLNEKQEEENKKERAISSAQKRWLTYGPKTPQAITKVKNAERIGKFWNAISAESSLRGKIITQFNNGYSSRPKLDRKELRKILSLK